MKKIPQRSCVICRRKRDKKDLIRIVKNKENEISIDLSGKKEGRGAYICYNIECLNKAIKNKGLERALDINKIDDNIYEILRERIIGGDVNNGKSKNI